MFCSKCGQQISEGAQFCPYCGAAQQAADPNGGVIRQAPPTNGGAAYQQSTAGNGKYGPFEGKMKWYKFLIYFALWASALLNASSGFQLLNGSHYGDSATASMVYAIFPKLKTVDTGCGIGFLAIAALAVVTALKLIHLKKDAPKFLIGLYSINIVLGLLYAYLGANTLNVGIGEVLDTSAISSLVTSAVMIGVNYNYLRNANRCLSTDGEKNKSVCTEKDTAKRGNSAEFPRFYLQKSGSYGILPSDYDKGRTKKP